jgi:16S rRNA processing protein RimM
LSNSSLDFKKKLPDGYVCIGYISGFWGVNGQAKIFLYNRDSSLFKTWLNVLFWDNKETTPSKIKMGKGPGKRVIASIEGINVKEEILPLLELKILLPVHELPKLNDEEYYHHQLLGLSVRDENDGDYGTVTEVVSGNVDIIVAQKGKVVHYIPFVSAEVLSIDIDDRILVTVRDRYED